MSVQQTILVLGLVALLVGLIVAKAYFAHKTKQRQAEAEIEIERQQTIRMELFIGTIETLATSNPANIENLPTKAGDIQLGTRTAPFGAKPPPPKN